MTGLCLALIFIAAAICAPLCAILIKLGHRLGTFDSSGVAGQIKDRSRRVPNTGGIAIFWGIVAPILFALAVGHFFPAWFPAVAGNTVPYLAQKSPSAILLIACLAILHIMGLIDDRTPLSPIPKLLLMAAPAFAAPLLMDTRLLTLLDPWVGGPWLSVLITAAWFLAITNAMNFLDNMDGLSAGIATIVSACLLVVTIDKDQWLLAACLSLTIGACLGFLCFNAPRKSGARLFMGDGGSLVIGFMLAFVTVRVTYYDPQSAQSSRAHATLMPLVILALPLYDLVVVTTVRLWNGKSPMVGDMNHASHRLVNRGLSRAGAVYLLWGLTAATGLAGLALARADGGVAALIGAMVFVLLGLLAFFEYAAPSPSKQNPRGGGTSNARSEGERVA
ncbi:MAG: undecaprenyl/decaprenyl-phosphate alpha-N-acetylglucosaminyl 1-phosphate transferase [Phycisphaeraceae bacterium]|nr:undecaprenyl/decaprenyl-phosphate alpha-N-acetylglucosaminyl 1-phosphate transferase [Phycisphaeraceae bacterium]